MRRYVTMVVGLALGAAICAAGQQAQAGEAPQYAFPFNGAHPQEHWNHDAQPDSGYYQGYDAGGCQNCQGGPGMDGSYMEGPCGCEDGACGYGGCDDCCDYGPGCDMLFGGLCGARCGRINIGADYLYVRANFSQATAYLVQNTTTSQGTVTGLDEFHDLDFRHESSYRLRGAYELGGCGEELRFTFTRFNSYAHEVIPYAADIIVPFGVEPLPGGETYANGDVDFKTYDLELAKVIPLGGTAACDCSCDCGCDGGCGGACGCGGCASCCPTWDITWSGGLRFADTDWRRTFITANEVGTTQAATVMNFEGGGVRVGLEGRRYLGCAGIFSLFLRGDLSLLLGHVDLRTTVIEDVTGGQTINYQTLHTRNVIPVTDIEGGLTAQVSCHTRLSAGYLFSAWGDLGMRDQEVCNQTLLGVGYDDANILAFDGLFVRLEADF